MKKFKRRGNIISTQFSEYEVAILTSLIEQLIELLTGGEDPRGSSGAISAAGAPRGDSTRDPGGAVPPAAGAPHAPEANEPLADPFALWEADLEADPDEPEISEDPVLQRLFPNAYPHDPAASSDFRRYTEREQRTQKVRDAQVVWGALAATEGGAYPVQVPRGESEAWLKTLTALRLAVAARLEITDAEATEVLASLPDEDPRTFMLNVYEWLGFAQETLIQAL